jgi:hypothetical protein
VADRRDVLALATGVLAALSAVPVSLVAATHPDFSDILDIPGPFDTLLMYVPLGIYGVLAARPPWNARVQAGYLPSLVPATILIAAFYLAQAHATPADWVSAAGFAVAPIVGWFAAPVAVWAWAQF